MKKVLLWGGWSESERGTIIRYLHGDNDAEQDTSDFTNPIASMLGVDGAARRMRMAHSMGRSQAAGMGLKNRMIEYWRAGFAFLSACGPWRALRRVRRRNARAVHGRGGSRRGLCKRSRFAGSVLD